MMGRLLFVKARGEGSRGTLRAPVSTMLKAKGSDHMPGTVDTCPGCQEHKQKQTAFPFAKAGALCKACGAGGHACGASTCKGCGGSLILKTTPARDVLDVKPGGHPVKGKHHEPDADNFGGESDGDDDNGIRKAHDPRLSIADCPGCRL